MNLRIALALSISALLVAACASQPQAVAVPAACPPPPVIPANMLTGPRNLCLLDLGEIPARWLPEWNKRCKTQPETHSSLPN